MINNSPESRPPTGPLDHQPKRFVRWSPTMVILGLAAVGLAFLPFVALRLRFSGQEGFAAGMGLGLIVGPDGRATMMFWDVYRLIPLISMVPGVCALLGHNDIPFLATAFCTTPPWVMRSVLVYPLISGVALIAAAFLPRVSSRRLAGVVIGLLAVIIGGVFFGRLIGGGIAVVLILGLCIPMLIAGSGIFARQRMTRVARELHVAAALALIVLTAAGFVLLIAHWRSTYPDRFGRVDPVVALVALVLLIISGLASIFGAVGSRRSGRPRRAAAWMTASRWACIVTMIALPSYVLWRTPAIVRDQAQRRLPRFQSASVEQPSSGVAASAAAPVHKKSSKKQKKDIMEALKGTQPPEVDIDSLVRTYELLAGKLLGFTWLYFWLLGSGLAGLVYRPLPLGQAAGASDGQFA